MVNGPVLVTVGDLQAAERNLALAYALADRRGALTALLALDDALAAVVRTTREPMIGQMRLTWWQDALAKLDGATPPAQPILIALAAEVVPRGVSGERLAQLVDAWDVLIEEAELTEEALTRFADTRGRLFAVAGVVLGEEAPLLGEAGAGWALADLAGHLTDASTAARARVLAKSRLERALAARWPSRVRPLGVLAQFARMDMAGTPAPGSPLRLGRAVWHRLTGR